MCMCACVRIVRVHTVPALFGKRAVRLCASVCVCERGKKYGRAFLCGFSKGE